MTETTERYTDPDGSSAVHAARAEWHPKQSLRMDRLRVLVWHTMRALAEQDSDFKDAVGNSIGIFQFMRVVDVVAECVILEQDAMDPLNKRLDLAESEIAFLRGELDRARALVGAEPAEDDKRRDG